MSVEPLVAYCQPIRDAHITALDALIARLRAEHAEPIAEALAEIDKPDVLAGILRFDGMVELDGPRIHEVDPIVPEGLPVGVTFEIDAVRCAFARFAWNRCRVQAEVSEAWQPALTAWFARWIDREGRRRPGEGGLAGVIHSVTGATWSDGLFQCWIDFGSASIDAPIELLDVLVDVGATSIAFGGSFDLPRVAATPGL